MGWAHDHVSAADREQIARGLFEVKDSLSGENKDHELWLRGLCPLHGEKNASFGYNVTEDYYKCFSCNAAGDLVDLWSRLRGLDKSEGFRQFRELVGGGLGSGESSPSTLAGKSVRVQGSRGGAGENMRDEVSEPAPPVIDEEVWERMPPLPDEWVKRLERERGWSLDVVKDFDLRLQTVYRRVSIHAPA